MLEIGPSASLEVQQQIWGLAERVKQDDRVSEVIPGMNNLTLVLCEARPDNRDMIEWLLQQWDKRDALIIESRIIDIPVHYGGRSGPDLANVAAHTQLSQEKVIERHCAQEYVVFFMGFQPGFTYLGGLDPRLYTPRLPEPRLKVPAGSVGIGGSQTGIYPLDSPGGWQIIGYSPVALFRPEHHPPTLLRPGDRIRFIPQKER